MRLMFCISLLTITVFCQSVCDLEGIHGLKFGMSNEETLEVPLNMQYTRDQLDSLKADLSQRGIKLKESAEKELLNSYTTQFSIYDATGRMFFWKDQLYQIIFDVQIRTTNENKYIDVYYFFKTQLTKKYGQPGEMEYLTGIYEDYFPNGHLAGQGLMRGYGQYYSFWKCPDNLKEIRLFLEGDNNEISLGLAYIDDSYNLSEEEREKILLEDF